MPGEATNALQLPEFLISAGLFLYLVPIIMRFLQRPQSVKGVVWPCACHGYSYLTTGIGGLVTGVFRIADIGSITRKW